MNKGRANEQGECPIFVRFRVNGTQIAMSIKRSVLPQNWDTTGQIIGTSPTVREIRNYMICISAKLMDCYDLLIKEQQEPTAMMVRQVFEGNSEPKATSSFFDVFDQYIAKQEELVGGDVSRLTLDRYILLKNTFEQFLIHKGDDPRYFTLKNLDKSSILNFVHYLKAFKKSGHNNAMKYLQRLKKFIFNCLNHKILDEDPFKRSRRHVRNYEKFNISHSKTS